MKLRKSLAILLTVAMLATCVVSVLPVSAENVTKAVLTGTNLISKADNILNPSKLTSSVAVNTGDVAVLNDGIYSTITPDHGKSVDGEYVMYRGWWSAADALWLTFDLGAGSSVSAVAYNNAGDQKFAGMEIYMEDVPYGTIKEDISSYTPVAVESDYHHNMRFDFTTAVTGRYLTFHVTASKPYDYVATFSEIAAIGTATDTNTVSAITATNKIAAADNMLAKGAYTSSITPSGGTVADLVDGKYGYVDNDAVAFDSRNWSQAFTGWFCYDFSAEAVFNSVAFSVGSGTAGVEAVTVYIANDPYTTVSANEANYTPVYSVTGDKIRGGTLVEFLKPLKGRYVIFKIKGGFSGNQDQKGVFVTELAATGKIPENAHSTTAVNKGFTVAENLLATAVFSTNVTPGAGTAENLVDGKCAWADDDAVIFDVRSWNLIMAWFCYDLGAEANIDKLFYNVGSGNQGMTGVDVFITNDNLDTVKANEAKYDPNVNVASNSIRGGTLVEFQKPQKGRYVIFKITSGLSGWDTQQAIFVSELGATGTIPYAETASHALGAQIRGENVTDQTAATDLRFAFKMDIPGVEEGEIDGTWDASAKIGEKQCSVLEMGLLVVKTSNSEDLYGDMVAESSNGNVVKMNANKIYEITSDDITVTGVVTNIGNADFGTEISMRAYMVCEIEGVPTPVYSDIITRCVNDLLGDA